MIKCLQQYVGLSTVCTTEMNQHHWCSLIEPVPGSLIVVQFLCVICILFPLPYAWLVTIMQMWYNSCSGCNI